MGRESGETQKAKKGDYIFPQTAVIPVFLEKILWKMEVSREMQPERQRKLGDNPNSGDTMQSIIHSSFSVCTHNSTNTTLTSSLFLVHPSLP